MRPSVTSATLCPTIQQHAERRREVVQFRHAVRARPLKPHHGDEIAIEFAALERGNEFFLFVKHDRRRFDDAMRGLDRGSLHHGAAEIAFQQADAAFAIEWIVDGAEDIAVQRFGRALAPEQ